ncbi:MAG: metallophosphoesterase family protein [Candidatus Gastranaerophilales bacterium]|nr:metallophosphoesterase family protein [Candidatus Gastranaerophilales bacterium]
MKVAVISDIHGNMQALEVVLVDIEKEKCEKILCLGDLAMAGSEPVRAIQAIKKLYDEDKLELIQGNTDEMIGSYAEFGEEVKSKFPIMGNALENDVQIIPEDLKIFLKNLPKQLELGIEGVKILLVHGSPRSNSENISPDLPIEKVEEMIAQTDAEVIFCGHTHIPCGYQARTKQTVINVGSVGRPFTPNPQACYVIVNFFHGTFEISHKFIDYDKQKAAKILAKRDFTGSDKLAQILIRPEVRHL